MTGLLFGLAPALQAGRASLAATLKDGSRGAGQSRVRNRLRSMLVVAEVALSLMLLVGASLFVRSMINIYNADAGIDTRTLMTHPDVHGGRCVCDAGGDDRSRRRRRAASRGAAGGRRRICLEPCAVAGGGGNAGIVAEGMTVDAGKEPRVSFFATTPRARYARTRPCSPGATSRMPRHRRVPARPS